MTVKQLLSQAKLHRKKADMFETLAKKQEKLMKQISQANSGKRLPAAVRSRLKSLPSHPKLNKGAVSSRLLDLLRTKTRSLDDLWTIVGPEQLTTNYLAMCRVIYSLNKKGLVESTAKGVWRATVAPTQEELHGKAS